MSNPINDDGQPVVWAIESEPVDINDGSIFVRISGYIPDHKITGVVTARMFWDAKIE